jgi:hypothetical protein
MPQAVFLMNKPGLCLTVLQLRALQVRQLFSELSVF